MNIEALYESNFHLWIESHIASLRESKFNDLDIDNLILELESMAKTDKRELVNRFIILIAHLLKWQYQPTHISNSWRSSIDEQRIQIEILLEDIPSLKNNIEESIKKAYPKAVKLASKETGLAHSVFPENCSYTEKEILDDSFYPPSYTN